MDGETPQTPLVGETPATPPPSAASQDDETFDPARAKALIEKLRGVEREYKRAAKELEGLKSAQQEAEQAKLSEQERLARRAADLEAKLAAQEARLAQERTARAVAVAAGKLGVNADLATRLLTGTQFETDDEGNPRGVEKALRETLATFGLTGAGTGATNPTRRDTTPQESPEQRRARLYGGGGSIFDPASAARLGGGVVWGDTTE